MRNLFGLDNPSGVGQDGAHVGDDDDDDGEEEMEITFAPALSGGLGTADDQESNKEETSLETYQRKDRERRQAKKEKKKADKKLLGGRNSRLTRTAEDDSDPDEAFDANAFGEAAGNDEDGQDDFFNVVADGQRLDIQEERNTTQTGLSRNAIRQLEETKKDKEAQALSLLVDDDDNGPDDGRHFDMQAILKAEKIGSKPKKILRKGKDRRKHKEAVELLEREKDRFEVNLKDDRFKSLHEDHEFALDPSNPRLISLELVTTRLLLTICNQIYEDEEYGAAAGREPTPE